MKRIMIPVDGSDNDEVSLRFAATLARTLGARLVVQFVPPPPTIVPGGGVPATVAFDNTAEVEDCRARARRAFEAVFANESAEARFVDHATVPPADMMFTGAACFDAVIVERVASEEGPEVAALNAALFDFGGPVIVVPPQPAANAGRHVAFAWSGHPAAMRALRGSLPLAAGAQAFTVLSPAGHDTPTDELEAYLAAHGRTAAFRQYGTKGMAARERGRALLAAADAAGADLLMTGAFGVNALMRIFGLGRTTRKLVTGCRIPVLLHA